MKKNLSQVLDYAAALLEVRAMPVLVRDTPNGHHWGFYTNEEPRMHLQTMHGKEDYKVWLERQGVRIFEPANQVPKKVLASLFQKVAEKERLIEAEWVRTMIQMKWVTFRVQGTEVVFSAYPRTSHTFERRIDLRPTIGDQRADALTYDDVAMDVESAALVVGVRTKEPTSRDSLQLRKILFTGKR